MMHFKTLLFYCSALLPPPPPPQFHAILPHLCVRQIRSIH